MTAAPRSRRSFLKMTVVGTPLVAGTALMAKGGLLVADLWWREQHVGEMAANTGRAQALHDLDAAGAPKPLSSAEPPPDVVISAILPAPDDAVASGDSGGRPIVGRLKIGSIGLDASMVRVAVAYKDGQPFWETADRAVGWHQGSGTPGADQGNLVISGHISSRNQGDVFRRLPNVQVGDESRVTVSGGRTAVYRVVDKLVVNPSDAWVMEPTKAPIATYICCVPDGVYSQRLVVVSQRLVVVSELVQG